jgi:hypothetical protein
MTTEDMELMKTAMAWAKRYRVNEIAVNWNSPLIYALAAFVSGAPEPGQCIHPG